MKKPQTIDDRIYKELFLASPVASYICDHNGVIVEFNAAAELLWGRKPLADEKWSGAAAVYYADGQPMALEDTPMARAIREQRDTCGQELIIARPNGARRVVLAFPKPIRTEAGQLLGAHNTLVDITEYTQYEEKQAILSEIVQSSEDAIVSKDLNGIIMSWNHGAERIFGYSEAEIVGKSINTLIPAYLQHEESTIISEIKAGKTVDHYQTIRTTKSGQEIPISLTISPMRNKAGHIIGASKIARDISDKIRREQTILFHEKKLETLHAIGKIITEQLDTPSLIQTVINSTTHLAAADVGICFYGISDEQGRSKLSAAAATLGGEVVVDFPDTQVEEGLIHTIFVGESAMKFDDMAATPHIQALFEPCLSPNAPTIRHSLAIPVRSADKLLIGAMFFGYAQIDEFNAADEDIMHSIASLVAVTLDNARLFEEVNALNLRKNEFIALASHELKTPLTTTKGYLQILERSEIDQVGRRFLTKALKQLERINALIAELLDISKIEAGKLSFHFEKFDMSEMILDVVETFHFSSQTHTVFVNNTHGDYLVEADRQRLEQVVINLITNAIKYSPDAHQVHVMLQSSPGEVTVQVMDEGMGMTPEQQEKVFTRFYQVEGSSKMTGLGLGLYLSKEIVERHGGHVGVNSQVGKGSTFYFSVPRTPQH
ncbi:PAS domain S-box protein [Parapedobacter sp. 10938]|uniref:PAS domain S-box protein n=1 Tax=Parapedobacter flavus TaxID=3110225 RepID=UPI002DBEBC33|nr:PAS domain S-box protein [Parapedobacter sp. 10938]MEC3881670.1 PAS domain S-box protein [Parapedobacter sp. 10938]